jgi:hypothetical protein
MQNATLVYSSKWYERRNILVYEDGTSNKSVNKLIDDIFYLKKSRKNNRVQFINNKYCYTPSNEYKTFVVRMKNIR